MKARPIIFTGHSVRAIIAGRKTQSRRLIRWPLRSESDGAKRRIFTEKDIDELNELLASRQSSPLRRVVTPYGRVGDRLWVKETWRTERRNDGAWILRFAEDMSLRVVADALDQELLRRGLTDRWRSSMFMPRWASRITLEVVGLRVERLHDITEADILAEGVTVPLAAEVTNAPWSSIPTLHDAWELLWDHINLDRAPWKSDPAVFVVTFRKVEAAAEAAE